MQCTYIAFGYKSTAPVAELLFVCVVPFNAYALSRYSFGGSIASLACLSKLFWSKGSKCLGNNSGVGMQVNNTGMVNDAMADDSFVIYLILGY